MVSAAKCKGNDALSSHKGINMFYALATRPAHGFHRNQTAAAGNHSLDRFLSDAFASREGSTATRAASVEDLEKNYTLQLDVPGISKEQLDIGIEGDVVRVNSKDDAARKVKAAWRFPLEIDAATSSAKLENGVLSLTLGKKVPVSNVSKLVIN